MFTHVPLVFLLAALFIALPCTLSAPVGLDKRWDYSGRATWFYDGLGACGYYDTDLDYLVALNEPQYESGQYCNRFILVENTQNGATAVAKVRDMCPGCQYGDLDMSPSLFKAISTGGLDEGVYPIQWSFYEDGWEPEGY